MGLNYLNSRHQYDKDPLDYLNHMLMEELLLESRWNKRNKEITLARAKEGKTYKEIGKQYGLSVERTRQIILKGCRIVRWKLAYPYEITDWLIENQIGPSYAIQVLNIFMEVGIKKGHEINPTAS